jgi:tetratricopeptide (TPR) repeat protein
VRRYQQGDYYGARQRFSQALSLSPTDANGYYNLAATHHRLGKLTNQEADLRQAENLYNQCLDRDPNHVDCHRGLAVLLADTGRPEAAIRLLEGWSARNVSSAEPKVELARLHQELGDRTKAIRALEEALVIEPHNARALAALGRLREEEGDLQQALANYQRSLSIDRFQPQVLARVAMLQAAATITAPVPPAAAETRVVDQTPRLNRY